MSKLGKWILYLVTDASFRKERSRIDFLTKTVGSAIRGGVSVVQYREKHLPTKKMVEEAKVLRELCRSNRVLFLVNDRIDVALAVDADGVHLGQDDMPVPIARRLLSGKKVIGLTVHNEKELREAERLGVDYVSFAPVFATPTKPDHQEPMGVEKLKKLVSIAKVPAVAIGGINIDNVEQVFRTGVDGVCVVSAIMGAPNPEEATRRLLERCGNG